MVVDAMKQGDPDQAAAMSARLRPVWDLFDAYGSYRVVSAIAEELGLVSHPNLPRPVRGLDRTARAQVRTALSRLADHAQGGTATN